ncbi:hypothetical protein NKR23_g10904 [Pleurostoma richardsiae]|uniref:Uncharacterized protein n=1 Tax=Pleurostoma richardsiae TaxID=41990 RepID=A0AA38R3Q4_9PEZI|nr:hypothetical protein NKR23_g10904 [Pleurostoma richardsiae]
MSPTYVRLEDPAPTALDTDIDHSECPVRIDGSPEAGSAHASSPCGGHDPPAPEEMPYQAMSANSKNHTSLDDQQDVLSMYTFLKSYDDGYAPATGLLGGAVAVAECADESAAESSNGLSDLASSDWTPPSNDDGCAQPEPGVDDVARAIVSAASASLLFDVTGPYKPFVSLWELEIDHDPSTWTWHWNNVQ